MRFGSLLIEYDDQVLEPRPWTAHQSHWAGDLLTTAPPGPVLELCTGAGQIGLLTIAATYRELVAVDLDPAAGELARRNAGQAGLASRVEVRQGDLQEVLGPHERFPLVVAGPPYLGADERDLYPATHASRSTADRAAWRSCGAACP
ncbi:methyltransferase domain-containing protein [Nocardioides euryhalodurans]|nr:methyltransferase domain-containing protein [Nocardioides euryhalodurans]